MNKTERKTNNKTNNTNPFETHNFSAYRRKDYITPRSTQEAYGEWVEIYVEEDEAEWFAKWWDRLLFLGGCLIWGAVGMLVLMVLLHVGGK